MNNYKIFNWQGKELLTIKADFITTTNTGQIHLYIIDEHGSRDHKLVSIFPDGTLIVEQSAIVSKPRQFNFVEQREEVKELKRRNEFLFAEKQKVLRSVK